MLMKSHKNDSLVKKKNFLSYVKQNPAFYVMLSPVILYFFIFCYIPMAGIIIAFMEYKPLLPFVENKWVGFLHFDVFINSPNFPLLMRNTILISLLRFIFGFPAPIILALLFNEVRNQFFKRVTQTISYMPYFLSWVILAGLITSFLDLDGPVNALRSVIGLEPKLFLYDQQSFWPMLVFTGIWKNVGFGTILYLAALAGAEPQLYEAAVIDGANRWQQTRYISLNALRPTIIILLIMSAGSILDAGFEQILLLQNDMVYSVSEVIDTFVYRMGFGSARYSFATAVGLFKSVVALILVVGSDQIAKHLSEDSLL